MTQIPNVRFLFDHGTGKMIFIAFSPLPSVVRESKPGPPIPPLTC